MYPICILSKLKRKVKDRILVVFVWNYKYRWRMNRKFFASYIRYWSEKEQIILTLKQLYELNQLLFYFHRCSKLIETIWDFIWKNIVLCTDVAQYHICARQWRDCKFFIQTKGTWIDNLRLSKIRLRKNTGYLRSTARAKKKRDSGRSSIYFTREQLNSARPSKALSKIKKRKFIDKLNELS